MSTRDPLPALEAEIGVTRHSGWHLVDQATIDRFAAATGDHQFIHVDPERAAGTPFGGTIAHGFLTLSLIAVLLADTPRPPPPGMRIGINYGCDRLRFIRPVRAGRRIRLASTLVAVERKAADRFQQAFDLTIGIEDEPGPALVARWLTQFTV